MATRGRMGDFSRAPTGIQAALPTGRQLAALARLVGWGIAWRLQEGQFDKLRSVSGVFGLLMALAYLRGNTQLAAHDGGSARPQPTHTAFGRQYVQCGRRGKARRVADGRSGAGRAQRWRLLRRPAARLVGHGHLVGVGQHLHRLPLPVESSAEPHAKQLSDANQQRGHSFAKALSEALAACASPN